VPAKKKPSTKNQVDAPPDPREPLPPTPANLQAAVRELEAVLASAPPPKPKEPAKERDAAKEPKADAAAAQAAAAPAATGAPAAAAPANAVAPAPPPAPAPASGPQSDLVDAMLHIYFADGLPCGYGQEARRRIAEGFVDRNEFRVTEAFEVEDMLQDLPIPNLFERCQAVRDTIAQIYNDQNGVNLAFLREVGISDRNTFFQRVPAMQPHVATFLGNLLTVEELCFSERSTLRAQQRMGLDPKDAEAGKFLFAVRELLKPYGFLPLDVGKHLPSRKPNLQHTLSPACILVRLLPAGRKRSS
jgi:hypothetical protein